MSTQHPPGEPARITVVETDACHFCEDAHRALDELADTYPLAVSTLEVHSDAGRHLMRLHRASMSPLVLLDGEFFSNGRLPRRKLARVLEQRRSLHQTSVG